MSAIDTTAPPKSEIEAYLHAQIPISVAMGVEVVAASASGVRLRAPLEPNINHQSTVFGGSAAAIAILAGWTLLHVRLNQASHESRIVIQNTYVQYDAPIDGAFEVVGRAPEPVAWERFVRTLERRRKARIEVRVDLEQDGMRAGGLSGAYVVVLDA